MLTMPFLIPLVSRIKSKMKSIILVLFLIPSFILTAQINEGIISYQSETIWSNEWEEIIREAKDTSSQVEKLDSIEIGIRNFISKHETKEKKDTTPSAKYFFNEKYARLVKKGENLNEVYRIYNIEQLIHYRHRIKNEKVKIDTFIWDYKINPKWSVKYDIIESKADTKTILGFNCHKVKIEERKQIEDRLYENVYELYVTDEIFFPAHLICGWYDYVLNECALEIKYWDKRAPKNYSITKATHFSPFVDKSVFIIPEILKPK